MSTPRFDIVNTPLDNRQLLVEASAGSGKTFALTGLVVRLVLDGVELNKILVVTFTNAATDELKTRMRGRLRDVLALFRRRDDDRSDDALGFLKRYGGSDAARENAIERLEAALLNVDEASVFTIHGFCQRVLQQSAFESGTPFEPEFIEDAGDLLDRAVADFLARRTHDDVWQALIAAKIKESTLRDHYDSFYRYPGVRLDPGAPALDHAIAQLEQAVDELCKMWPRRRDQTATLLRATKFKARTDLTTGAEITRVLDGLDSHLATAPHECIGGVIKLATSHVTGAVNRTSSKNQIPILEEEPFFACCERVRAAFEVTQHSFIHSFLIEVRRGFDALKRSAGVLTFDDLLQHVDSALADGSDTRDRLLTSIRNRWTHALIDEFQDTDPLQYRIFRTAFAGRPLVFVGDPKQAIYSFRGADLHAYLRAREDTEQQDASEPPSRYMLEKNWRSATGLVEAVNALFGQAAFPFLLENVPYESVEAAGVADEKPLEGDDLPPLVWWTLEAPEDGGSWNKRTAKRRVVSGVVAGVKQLLASRATINGLPVSPADLAVLVRQNDEGAAIQQALREAGIPAVISKSGDVWNSAEVADLEHVLRAFLQPSDRTSLCSGLATDLWGTDATAVHAIQQDEEKLEDVRAGLNDYQSTWRRHGVLRALMQFVEDQSVTERLLSLIDGERRLTNLRHALELLHNEESRHNRGPDELLQWLRTRESRHAEDRETAELRLESDEEAVQIVTIHKSKGLQYDIVIAPFLWSAKQNYKSDANVLVHDGAEIVYDIGSARHAERRRIADAERLAEDLRLTYVALTRAVHRCYVVWGGIRQAECSAPAYLLHGHRAVSNTDLHERAAAAFEAPGTNAVNVRDSLDALVGSSLDLMTIEDLPLDGPVMRQARPSTNTFTPRVLSEQARQKLIPWSVTSYSQIASGDPHEAAFYSIEGGERNGLFAFATGRVAGNCLHEIIEEVDLSALDEPGKRDVPEVERLVDRKLRAFGLDRPAAHRGGEAFDPQREVMELLGRIGHATIPLAGAALPALDARRILREWSFTVPVDAISPNALADAVSEHAPAPIRTEYPKRLRRLDQGAVNGYLTGIADFAFEHEGRWYVLDWKSTNLGSRWEDYAPDRLVEAALDRHYVLQLLIYSLGLHRYLKTRMPDYDYDRHIGGAGVVFLRGIDGSSESGFYVIRPPVGLIRAMDEMLKPVPA